MLSYENKSLVGSAAFGIGTAIGTLTAFAELPTPVGLIVGLGAAAIPYGVKKLHEHVIDDGPIQRFRRVTSEVEILNGGTVMRSRADMHIECLERCDALNLARFTRTGGTADFVPHLSAIYPDQTISAIERSDGFVALEANLAKGTPKRGRKYHSGFQAVTLEPSPVNEPSVWVNTASHSYSPRARFTLRLILDPTGAAKDSDIVARVYRSKQAWLDGDSFKHELSGAKLKAVKGRYGRELSFSPDKDLVWLGVA